MADNFKPESPDEVLTRAAAAGVDLSMLRENLKLTPTERLLNRVGALEFVEAAREAGRIKYLQQRGRSGVKKGKWASNEAVTQGKAVQVRLTGFPAKVAAVANTLRLVFQIIHANEPQRSHGEEVRQEHLIVDTAEPFDAPQNGDYIAFYVAVPCSESGCLDWTVGGIYQSADGGAVIPLCQNHAMARTQGVQHIFALTKAFLAEKNWGAASNMPEDR